MPPSKSLSLAKRLSAFRHHPAPDTAGDTLDRLMSTSFYTTYRLPDMPGADVYYRPDFVDPGTAQGWYAQLEALDTWYQPTLKVYGRDKPQSRHISAYVTDPSITVKYSNHTVTLHHPLPPVLRSIQDLVEHELQVSFNHVMLNRYDEGSVCIGRHRDTKENKVIASLSLGAERTFIMSPDKKLGPGVPSKRLKLASGSLLVMQGDTQVNWKHEIPKEGKVTEGRISLTFRQLVGKGVPV